MEIDFGRLVIHNVIIHEIPRHRRGEEGVVPILSQIESPLTDNLRTFLREKVIQSAGSSSAYRVCFLESPTSPIPQYIQEHLTHNEQTYFITMSQGMANHLLNIQSGINPQGLLTVVGCAIGGRSALGILKIEKEEGIRLSQKDINGKLTFDLQHIRELMLTKKTKLFKIGLFALENDDANSIHGFVCDYQRGRTPKKEVADFFLEKFLGCELYSSPPIETKRFLNETQNFINTHVHSPSERAVYENHLLSELTNEKPTINPREFAEDNLKVELRQPYIEYLEANNITENQFDKDITLVKRHIEKMLIDFTNGIKVIAPHDVYEDSVNISHIDNGQDRVEITGRIEKITSA